MTHGGRWARHLQRPPDAERRLVRKTRDHDMSGDQLCDEMRADEMLLEASSARCNFLRALVVLMGAFGFPRPACKQEHHEETRHNMTS